MDDAIALYEETLKKSKATLGPDHPDTLRSMYILANAYNLAGKLDQAEHLWLDWLERQRNKDDRMSPDTANELAILGVTLLKQEKYVQAEPLLRECLTIRAEKIPDDWLHFNAMNLLGGSLLGQKKYTEAEPLLLQGHEGMRQREANIPPEGKLRLTEAVERLVELYDALGHKEQGDEWRKKLPVAKSAKPAQTKKD